MTKVSGVELVVAACRNGVIGSFPTHNATAEQLPAWLDEIEARLEDTAPQNGGARRPVAPFAVNLIVHPSNSRRDDDIDRLIEHGVELVITSVGSPAAVVPRLHDGGIAVLADVASLHHAERAIAAGVDGLVLLSAGAGGQTGWLNPLAYIRAVRERYDGTIVLAGGISDGVALAAAITAGADLAYMGTRFIATHESSATDDYKAALVDAGPDEIQLTTAYTGLPANLLAVPDGVEAAGTRQPVAGFEQSTLLSLKDAWSAGHSVGGVARVTDVATLVRTTRAEYLAAMQGEASAAGRPGGPPSH
jgi:nitronate monooxygenase